MTSLKDSYRRRRRDCIIIPRKIFKKFVPEFLFKNGVPGSNAAFGCINGVPDLLRPSAANGVQGPMRPSAAKCQRNKFLLITLIIENVNF